MNKTLKLIPFVFLLSTNAFSLECPNVKAAPPCPTSGAKILDESYPTQAFVVSNLMKSGFVSGTSKVPEDFTMNVIKSYDYENIPQVIFPFTKVSDYEDLKKAIEERLKKDKISPDKIKKILGQLTRADAPSYTWQQDYFISQFDPASGRPVLSQFDSYGQKFPGSEKSTSALTEASSKCGTTSVPSLKESKDSFGSGEMGGNTQALPGGFCLIGDNQGTDLSEKFCGSKDNIVNVNTSWQAVGHVDEIFKIIPTNYLDGRPKECQFSFLAASPRKAMELMKQEKNKDTKMFNFNPKLSVDELRGERVLKSSNYNLCNYIKRSGQKRELQNLKGGPATNSKSVFWKIFIESTYAGVKASKAPKKAATKNTGSEPLQEKDPEYGLLKVQGRDVEYERACESGISELTNGEFLKEMEEDKKTLEINQLVQESIDKDKELVKKNILSRLPQCANYFEMTDVPDLFYGSGMDVYTDKDGKRKLTSPGVVRSLLPNPTNSVVMNKTLLIPESNNSVFNNYITEELGKKRIKTSYIDVWEFAHMLDGNMHCSSHSINYCSPVVK